MILLVDNYDSFTYNLVQLFPKETEIQVVRNDAPELIEIAEKAQGIVLSPGPGRPNEAGLMETLIKKFYQRKPILGICLGHQGIAEVFGGKIIASPQVVHGKQSFLTKTKRKVMRYHSLIVEKTSFPDELMVTEEADELIMAFRHRDYPVYGLQFHPESIGTENGQQYLQEFLQEVRKSDASII